MSATENKQLLQQIFAGLAENNARLFVASMAEDFRWTVTGTTKWSRTYSGKKAVLGELFAVLSSKMAGPIRTLPDRIIAEGDYVVVQAHGDNVTKSGKAYNNRYCFVFRVADGKLKEVTEYLDTELVTAALSE